MESHISWEEMRLGELRVYQKVTELLIIKSFRMKAKISERKELSKTHHQLMLIHVDAWQNPSQYCKVIILLLKKFFLRMKAHHPEWIKKLWYIHTMEYHSGIRTAFEAALTRWTNLEPIIQSEVSQKEADKYRMLTCICGI